MANKRLFATARAEVAPAVNHAGGRAFDLDSQSALAQLAVTGCLNQTYYVSEEEQLGKVLELAKACTPEWVGKVALYSREQGAMKDMPALLLTVLAGRAKAEPKAAIVFEAVAARILDSARMVRNFAQMVRSGVAGRRSFGSRPKRAVRAWFERFESDDALFRQTVGGDPSISDVIKMVHPKPKTESRGVLYRYLIGRRDFHVEQLPALVQAFEKWKATKEGDLPDVPFEMLTALELGTKEWKKIAERASWTQTRMNLNTFKRHGVLDDDVLVDLLAKRLANPELVRKARAMPHQTFAAYRHGAADLPNRLVEALHDAMEVACENVPELPGKVYVFPDVSGSMSSPVSGSRPGATSKMSYIDVAALFASAILRRNKDAILMPFEQHLKVVPDRISARDTILTNAKKLAALGGGGTDCSAPLRFLNEHAMAADLCIFVSDNESWMNQGMYTRSTGMAVEWATLKRRCPKAKLVCIDISPNTSCQAPDRDDVLNVGGFNDKAFEVVARFAAAGAGKDSWKKTIEEVQI